MDEYDHEQADAWVEHMLNNFDPSNLPFRPEDGPHLPHQNTKFPRVSRVELIVDSKRDRVLYGVRDVELYLQDDERTLKVFLDKEVD